MNIAIIPARGGSKRIPRKNIKVFNGKPMIAHAITAASASGLFEHVVVSTDDAEIANVARQWGAETPFLRPATLADDYVATVPVIAHGVQACRALNWEFENVCCMYPAVPFIRVEDLGGSLEVFRKGGADFCFSVTKFPAAVQRALGRSSDGRMQPLFPQFETMRTQDLEPAYHDAAQFYWGKAEAWLRHTRIFGNAIGYVLPNWRVADIDTDEDWRRAEMMLGASPVGSGKDM